MSQPTKSRQASCEDFAATIGERSSTSHNLSPLSKLSAALVLFSFEQMNARVEDAQSTCAFIVVVAATETEAEGESAVAELVVESS